MTDLETRLRQDLAQAADSAGEGLEVADVVAAGHRVRVERIIRRTMGGIAVAALALLVLPSVGNWSVPGVPDPMSTVPAPTTSTTIAVTTFDLSPLTIGMKGDSPFESVTVTALARDGVASELTVRGERAGASGTPQPAVSQTTIKLVPGDTRLAVGRLGDRVTVGLLPELATSLEVLRVKDAASTQSWNLTEDLASLGGTVFLHITDVPEPAGTPVAGVVWRNPAGQIRSSSGQVVGTTTFRSRAGDVTVVRDPALAHLGFVEGDQFGWANTWEDPTDPAGIVKLDAAKRSAAGVWERVVIGVLPAGATNPKVGVVDSGDVGDSGIEVAVGELAPDDRTGFAIHAKLPNQTPVVTSVTYTSADGKQVVWTP